ncbi:type II toxin-antitoxin system RelE family toxin [Sapientia aquatica]|jgi:mRNA-degrading endonuclease RelE of RelBE toxin-antitoxin system|uniref:Type II toxin-antitoxin system RelE/ParE family toxin n=1 Tax=Sapientia aquatica TaxID=1549640 RepID=A0A4R5W5G8_9BURK|nr:type II toxin-antitoxin system RelE/ParE family toxin [Sapientia aquatica]TDK68288.1 type II toxin-antitoxin system RelE/ParE family toxin [Sapientia aquatica]
MNNLYNRTANSVSYALKAAKQLRKLPAQDSKKIRTECDKLVNMPDCINVKALTNHDYQFRLRVGNYRVFFNFDGAIHIVTIEEVKKRDENTY